MFSDKVVWITGASSGIGEAIAQQLGDQGATLVLTARRADRLQQLQRKMRDPSRVHLLVADLSQDDPVVLAAEAERLAGPLDILINNAGISQRARALDTLLQDVRALMEINFFAPIALTNAVLPGMLARGRGRIVVVSSVAGYVGTPMRSSYSASKHAIRGYYDSLRAELHGTGVQVTVVCPGYVRTDISESSIAAGGGPYGQRDRAVDNGISADVCARAIVGAIRKNKSELHVGGREVLAIYAKRLLPRLVERIVPSQAPR